MHRTGILALLVLLAADAGAAPLTDTLDLGAVWRITDNASRAFDRDEAETAQILRVDLGSEARRRDADGRGFDVVARVGLESVLDHHDLDRADADVRLRWTLAPGAGYGTPFVALEAGLTGLLHRDSRIRDGAIVELALLAGARATDRVDWLAGWAVEARRARDAGVFDLRRTRLFLRGEQRHGRDLVLWARAEVGAGDVVATGSPSLRLLALSEARADDDVFETGRIAYRLDAVEAALAVGFSWQPAADLGVEFSLSQRWIEADDGVDYRVAGATASALWRLRGGQH